MVHLGRPGRGRDNLSDRGDCRVCLRGWLRHLWRLVFQENEAARHHHMKKFYSMMSLAILLTAQQAMACPFCYGAKDGKATEHMAVAIWFLFGAVMAVLGGIGAVSYSIYRHGRMPIPPHEQLIEEDFEKYE